MGLALFVLTAIAGRFAYPAVSLESDAFWIIQSSPVSLSRVLWIKFFVYLVPLFLLTQVLIVWTNILLNVTPFMMGLSIVTTAILVPAIIALAIGIGSIYADFNLENPLKSVTGFGGMVYMICCAILVGGVIMLEAGPVYSIFMSGIKNKALSTGEWVWNIFCFTLVPVISVLCIIVPMKLGAARLKKRQS
jgi:ABC-2 type transport system permease protein